MKTFTQSQLFQKLPLSEFQVIITLDFMDTINKSSPWNISEISRILCKDPVDVTRSIASLIGKDYIEVAPFEETLNPVLAIKVVR